MNTLPEAEKARFWRQRLIIYVTMFVGWSCFVLCRRILPASTTSLIEEQGFRRDEVGMIISSFSTGYGVSKLVMSILSDHVSPRKMFSIGLILTGFSSIIFPIAKNIWMASFLRLMTGILQGCGWAPCAVLLKNWYPPSQMGRWWSLLSTAGNVATALCPLVIIYISSLSDWTTSYYVAGLVTFIAGCTAFLCIKDSPAEIGIKVDFGSTGSTANEGKKSASSNSNVSGPSWYSIFFMVDLWIVAIVYACVYAVKDGILGWSLLYFTEVSGKSKESAAACSGVAQVGGILGNIVVGSISDAFITSVSLHIHSTSTCTCMYTLTSVWYFYCLCVHILGFVSYTAVIRC